MVKGYRAYLAALSLLAGVGLSANSYASDQEGLQLELTPYLWAAGFDGKVTRGLESAKFDASFSDISDNIDSGGSLLFVTSINRFVLFLNYDSVGLKSDAQAGALSADGQRTRRSRHGYCTAAAGYRFDTFGRTAGSTCWSASACCRSTQKFAGPGSFTANIQDSDDVTDTVIMLRPSIRFAEKWRFNPTFDYGVSGDSETTYTHVTATPMGLLEVVRAAVRLQKSSI